MGFQDVKNGDPVFAGGFHADIMAAMFEQSVTEQYNVGVVGRKSPDSIGSFQGNRIGNTDGCNHGFFMDIQTGTGKVNNIHVHDKVISFLKVVRAIKKEIPALTAIQAKRLIKGVMHQSQMISVRAQCPNCLCLNRIAAHISVRDKMVFRHSPCRAL